MNAHHYVALSDVSHLDAADDWSRVATLSLILLLSGLLSWIAGVGWGVRNVRGQLRSIEETADLVFRLQRGDPTLTEEERSKAEEARSSYRDVAWIGLYVDWEIARALRDLGVGAPALVVGLGTLAALAGSILSLFA